MEQLLGGSAIEIGRQPWSPPYCQADIFRCSNEMVFRLQVYDGKSLPTAPLHIWEYPNPGGGYVVAVDPSSMPNGKGDPAAIQVVGGGGRQVAEMLLVDRDPEEQLRIAVWLAEFYNQAILSVEMNGNVGAYMNQRLERGLYGKLWRNPISGSWGWFTTQKTRQEIVSQFHQSLTVGIPMMRSYRLREELNNFTGDHSREKRDDLTMAFLIAHYCAFNQHYCFAGRS